MFACGSTSAARSGACRRSFFVDRNDLIGAEDNDGAPVADQSASPARAGRLSQQQLVL